MNLLSFFAQELQDLWRLFFPPTYLDDEDEDALPIDVETSYQRISSLIQQDGSYRAIILDPKELIPAMTLGSAALSSVQDRGSVNFFIEQNVKNSCNVAQQPSILNQIAALRR